MDRVDPGPDPGAASADLRRAARRRLELPEQSFVAGTIDRFDWKLVGKKEMLVPYNAFGAYDFRAKFDDIAGPDFVAPSHRRYELHRVWVVEATLRAGQRHQAARSRYYCDEDTWTCVLGDRWDANGQLWKTTWGQLLVMPELPGTFMYAFGFNDLLSDLLTADGPLRERLETVRDQLPELAAGVRSSSIQSPGMTELAERISRARTSVENWLDVDDTMRREAFPDAQVLQDRMRIAMSRWPLTGEVPARVKTLADKVAEYYESGEKSREAVL